MGEQVLTPRGQPIFRMRAACGDEEIGRQIGAAMAADIAAMWETFMRPLMPTRFGTPEKEFDRTYTWLRNNLERVCPWMAQQIEGVAAGCGLGVRELYLMNHYSVLWSAGGLGCTSIATVTDDAGPVMAQNLDIGAEDFYFAGLTVPRWGYAILSDRMCGMCWAPTGINAAGLAIGSSNLGRINQPPQRPLAGGIVNTMIPHAVLRSCATVDEALEFIRSLPEVCPSSSGYQLNLIDAQGRMAVVDKTGPRMCIRQCLRGFNFTTNVSLDPSFEAWRTQGKDNAEVADGWARARFVQRAYESLGEKAITSAWLRKLLASSGCEGALCRRGEVITGSYTRLSMMYHPRLRRMEIANGPPADHGYEVLDWDDPAWDGASGAASAALEADRLASP